MTKLIKEIEKVKFATKGLRVASEKKDEVLRRVADLIDSRKNDILKANEKDLKKAKGVTPAFLDRLTLTEKRLGQICESLEQVANLPDPVGEQTTPEHRLNGLKMRRVRSPLGVIFMIFESRPNVAVESFSIAFKAGNGVILRGGRESTESVGYFYQLIQKALVDSGFSKDCLMGITNPDRKLVKQILKIKEHIDVVVPRGGDKLIEFVVNESLIPIIKNDRGMCHIYVHDDADLEMARRVVDNAKTQRPGVCNAMETLLVNKKIAHEFLPKIYQEMSSKNVQWYCCKESGEILKGQKNIFKATKRSFDTEYLDLKINCKLVANFDEAIEHIEKHGSKHSEAIITSSFDIARKFQDQVDAAATYWNASTRFTDGFEMGLGGELGISTQKLHVRGPVGIKELTSWRWVIDGHGQIRN